MTTETSIEGTDPDSVDAGIEQAGQSAVNREALRRRIWWIIVLILLLLLGSCLVAQLLFPRARESARTAEARAGLTPVFGVYGLHMPLGVASMDDGSIVVADTAVQRVSLYDERGRFVRRIGGDTVADKVFSVDGVMADGDTIFVSDWSLRRVWMFARDGKVKGFFPKDPMSSEFGASGLTPYDVVRVGNDVLVSSRNGIYRFDVATGKSKGRFDKTSPDGIQPLFVNGLTYDPESKRVFACDTLNRRVIAYDVSGRALWRLGQRDAKGKIISLFGLPRGAVMTSRGLLVSDAFNHVLYLLDADGNLKGVYGSRGVLDGQFNFPEGLDVAPDGLLYVADRENNRVSVLKMGSPVAASKTVKRKWDRNYERIQK